MKLTVLDESKGIGAFCRYFLNGDEVTAEAIMEADSDEGYIISAELREARSPICRFIYEYGNPFGCRTRMRRGEVEIRPRDDAPECVRRWFAEQEADPSLTAAFVAQRDHLQGVLDEAQAAVDQEAEA